MPLQEQRRRTSTNWDFCTLPDLVTITIGLEFPLGVVVLNTTCQNLQKLAGIGIYCGVPIHW